MNTQNMDAIVDRIRKCLNLAHGLNATQGEMEAAMGKAKEIAMRHNIELANISLGDGNNGKKTELNIERTDLTTRSKKPQLYHRWVLHALTTVFGVRVIWLRGCSGAASFCLVGEAVDVAICRELFPWLESLFYRTYYDAMKIGKVVSCAAHKNGIYRGMADGIIAVNRREEAKLTPAEAGCLAMVVRDKSAAVDRRVAVYFPRLSNMRRRSQQIDGSAYGQGVRAGRKVNLYGVSGAKTYNQIGV